jgi:transcriptional regulator with XRE-family HTH domain
MVRVPLSDEEIAQGCRLGGLLRVARAERTLGAVASGAGVSVETLRKIETGRIPTPSFATVAAVAEELGLSMDQLWRHVRATPPGDQRAVS